MPTYKATVCAFFRYITKKHRTKCGATKQMLATSQFELYEEFYNLIGTFSIRTMCRD